MKEELTAGAWKVIAEGRESGTAGIYSGSFQLGCRLIDQISAELNPDQLLWEAPCKQQQTWLIKRQGVNVNLGNIEHDKVIALETLRQGIRTDTLMHFHG